MEADALINLFMRHFLLFLFLGFLTSPSFAQSKDTTVHGTCTTNLLGPFSLCIEGKTGNKNAIAITGKSISVDFLGSKTTYTSFTGDFRLYFKSTTLSGFYISPYVKYRYRRDLNKHLIGSGVSVDASVKFFGGERSSGIRKFFQATLY